MDKNKLTLCELDFLEGRILFSDKDKKKIVDEDKIIPLYFDDKLCKNCNNIADVVYDQQTSSIICKNCGSVINEINDSVIEWTDETDKYSGKRTDNNTCSTHMQNMRNWSVTYSHKEVNIRNTSNYIKECCKKENIPGIITDDAIIMYKMIYDDCIEKTPVYNNAIIRGTNRIGLIASCVMHACKRGNYTKNIKTIAKMFGISTARVNKGYNFFIEHIKTKNIDCSENLTHPIQYTHHFCECLGIDKKIAQIISDVTMNVQKLNFIYSHTPMSIATACILICSNKYNLHIDKQKLSTLFGISETTIMKTHMKIMKYESIIFDSNIVDKVLIEVEKTMLNIETPKMFLDKLKIINSIDVDKFEDMTKINLIDFL